MHYVTTDEIVKNLQLLIKYSFPSSYMFKTALTIMAHHS